MDEFREIIERKQIFWHDIDSGDAHAGLVRVLSSSEEHGNTYRININKNHELPTRFATLAHELGHIFLGHLGPDKRLKIKDRRNLSAELIEIEAESVSQIACTCVGIESRSGHYLSAFVENNNEVDNLDVYAILAAAGAVASLLKINTEEFRASMKP